MESIYAIRGAINTDFDGVANIDREVRTLMDSLYEANGITDDDVAFIIFSQTDDLRSRNAAAAFRATGRGASIPLFCVKEAEIYGAMPRVIRVMVVINHAKEKEPRHVYLGDTASLRPDLQDVSEG